MRKVLVVCFVLALMVVGAAAMAAVEMGIGTHMPNSGDLSLSKGNDISLSYVHGKFLGTEVVTSIDVIGGMNRAETMESEDGSLRAEINACVQMLTIGPRFNKGKGSLLLAAGVARNHMDLKVTAEDYFGNSESMGMGQTDWRLSGKAKGSYDLNKNLSAYGQYIWTGVNELSGAGVGLTYAF